MATKQKGTYALLAMLLLTAMSVGMSVDGYPAGGAQQGAGEDWAKDSIANGCSCHMDEQLDEGMYMLNGIPSKYIPDTTYNISTMKTAFIIALVISCTLASDSFLASNKKLTNALKRIDTVDFGKNLLDTIALQIEAGGPM